MIQKLSHMVKLSSFLILINSFLMFAESIKKQITPNLIFHQSKETLSKIIEIIAKEKKGAYFRFGDGDVNLATGQNDMLQNKNSHLQQEMREAFAINAPNVLKSLPLHNKEFGGYEKGMFPGNHAWNVEQCINFINKIKPLWNKEITNVYAQAALHFSSTNYPNFCIHFLKFLKSNHCLLVGNKNIPEHIRTLLFGKNCKFVPTPDKQSYTEIDRVEHNCLEKLSQANKYTVVITAMGCSGRVLQKRLWKKLDNIFLFDFGSLLDALCGWNTRAWIELSKFNKNEFINKLQKPDIHILYTAALIDNQFEYRKKEYIDSLNTLFSMGYKPHIVDACKKTDKSFFQDHCGTVLYAGTNNLNLRNKGVNEIQSLIAACNHYQFNDEDVIIKITGRYKLNSDQFLQVIENNPEIDGWFAKDSTQQVRSGCFALRYKYLKHFLNTIDLYTMEKNMINFELLLAQYAEQIKKQGVNIQYVERLDLTANIFGTGKIASYIW